MTTHSEGSGGGRDESDTRKAIEYLELVLDAARGGRLVLLASCAVVVRLTDVPGEGAIVSMVGGVVDESVRLLPEGVVRRLEDLLVDGVEVAARGVAEELEREVKSRQSRILV